VAVVLAPGKGSFQSEAMLSVSWNSPSPVAPSPKKRGNTAAIFHLSGERRAAGDRHTAGDDAVGAEHSDREVGDVREPPLPLQ
jgi:hypothetical protein